MSLTDPFKQNFRTYAVRSLLERFSYNRGDSWFLAIAKPTEWTDDDAPPKSLDCIHDEVSLWQNALAFKRIDRDDVSLVVRRIDWTSGVVYDAYRDNVDLFDDKNPLDFYVLVEESRVYKCIDNAYGVVSTVAPTHTDATIRKTSDGYRWKFLYSISENDRKFLTKDWMPVDYVAYLESNEDDHRLQYEVQQSAVPGSIDFIELVDAGTTFGYAIPSSSSNQVAASASAGATFFDIGGDGIATISDAHAEYVIKIDSGPGEGQQRVITRYAYNANNTGRVYIDNPLDYALVNDGVTTISKYSIVPQVKVVGNGSRHTNSSNSYITTAEATARIDSDRRITSIEMIDTGEDYTFAYVQILPTDQGATARAVISPKNGHGSNPIDELGAATFMIATELTQDENSTVTVGNEYRQIALVTNPITRMKKTYLRIAGTGTTNTFGVGYTANQIGSGFYGMTGYISEWSYSTSVSGNSEIVLRDYYGTGASSTWQAGATFTSASVSRKILEVEERTIAGREGRVFYRIRVVPPDGVTAFSVATPAFADRSLLVGRGITSTNKEPETRRHGRVLDFSLEPAVNTRGTVYVENLDYGITSNENLWEMNFDYTGITGPKAKVSFIAEGISGASTVYDNTWRMRIAWDGVNYFTTTSPFEADQIVYSVTGASAVTAYSNAILIDYLMITGGTQADVRLLNTAINGNGFSAGHSLSGASDYGFFQILSVQNEPDIVPYSGEVVYIQNIKPIERDPEQKEEIKLIIRI